jgi:hypothetical protein
MDAPAAIEGEQWRAGIKRWASGPTAFDLFGQKLADVWAKRDEAALAKLTAADDKGGAIEVDVAQAQATCLAGPQPQPIAEGEDGPIGRASLGSPGPVWEGGSSSEQLTCLVGVEHERDAPRG